MTVEEFLKKNGLKEGDIIEVRKEKQFFRGTILPASNQNILTLKLESGYNAGIKID